MMIRKQHIGLYRILAAVIYCFAGCGPAAEEKWAKEKAEVSTDSILAAVNEQNEMENTFESDTLTNEQLTVFQQRATQKVQDFVNYVEIISNKSFDTEMRQVARQQIQELFADSTITISIPVTDVQKIPCSLSEFLNYTTATEYDSIKVKTDSLISIQPKVQLPSVYKGFVQANVSINGYKNGKIVFNSSAFHKAETIIAKTQKQFGSANKMIWTAMIGELR